MAVQQETRFGARYFLQLIDRNLGGRVVGARGVGAALFIYLFLRG